MQSIGSGERAAFLPPFRPDGGSLTVLYGASPEALHSLIRIDVGLALALLSYRASDHSGDFEQFLLRRNDAPGTWCDWRHPTLLPIYRTACSAAHYAELIASASGRCRPEDAVPAAWLPFVPWLAVGAVDPSSIPTCLSTPIFSDDPWGAQLRSWGLSRSDLGGRLSESWQMPAWASLIMGRSELTPREARDRGGDAALLAVAKLAAALAENSETMLLVADEVDVDEAVAELGLNRGHLASIQERYNASVDLDILAERSWSDPTAESADSTETIRLYEQEEESIDFAPGEDERLRDAKLEAMAEFAAGASHEINNPLAIISAHCQYLMRKETDEAKLDALRKIVRQTERVHSVLTDLMNFARPSEPKRRRTLLGDLIHEACESTAGLSTERRVAIETQVIQPMWINVDPTQIRRALSALVRNAVEAAGENGWVHVRPVFRDNQIQIIVDDSGSAPNPKDREHMFDPFYSGRSAGRGRGLGLSTAWRLAREHGGDVQFVPLADGPTRFILTLPAAVSVAAVERKSA